MLREEFSARTGFYPTMEHYRVIEEAYYASEKDKDDFCQAFLQDEDGIAQKTACDAEIRLTKERENIFADIKRLEERLSDLMLSLEREQEWEIFQEEGGMSDKSYEILKNNPNTRVFTVEEAKQYVMDTFGFREDLIHIETKKPIYEINRHKQIRKKSETERKPLYQHQFSNYIYFTCNGFSYEIIDGGFHVL